MCLKGAEVGTNAPAARELLRHAVEDQRDFEIAAAAIDGQSFQVLVTKHRPDVVIVDHMLRGPRIEQAGRFGRTPRLAEPNGLELIERTRTLLPEATIAFVVTACVVFPELAKYPRT